MRKYFLFRLKLILHKLLQEVVRFFLQKLLNKLKVYCRIPLGILSEFPAENPSRISSGDPLKCLPENLCGIPLRAPSDISSGVPQRDAPGFFPGFFLHELLRRSTRSSIRDHPEFLLDFLPGYLPPEVPSGVPSRIPPFLEDSQKQFLEKPRNNTHF